MFKKLILFSLFYTLFILTSVSAKPVNIIGLSPDKTVSIKQIDHHPFDHLLYQYVDGNGDVDYTAWKANDVGTLTDYLESLSAADPDKKASKASKLAYWINAYNALTIYGILEKYPTSSIRNHTSVLFGYNIWKDLKLQVAVQTYSLDQMEHEILRKMNEPRIHFAIVCASHSCPRLLNEAFEAEKIEQQLNSNAKLFFKDTENFSLDEDKKILYLSSILDWFGEDFGKDTPTVVQAIKPWLPDTNADMTDWKVKYLPYSWKLNDQKTAKKRRKPST